MGKARGPLGWDQSFGHEQRSLRRIAEALGVPVSSFYEPESLGSETGGLADRDEAAVLGIVQVYLKAVDPEARERFVTTVRNMALGASR